LFIVYYKKHVFIYVIEHTIKGKEASFYDKNASLNHIERGGTIFFIDDKNTEQLVKNKENRAVIFDINLYHKSQKFEVSSQKKKMAIGFRMKSQSI
jgi:hypothetical protein